jgi:Secretion system C-terminal sorting domain
MRAASFFSLGMALAGHAQVLTDDGAGLFVQSGAQLTVKGEVLIGASGTITNSGTIDLSGNWTNNAGNDCFGDSEGAVILNGAGQQIGGSSYTQFNHLHLLGGDVTLMQDAYTGGGFATSRSGVLALNGAKLFLNSRLLGLTNAEPSAVTRTTGMLVSETGPAPGYGRVNWFIGDHAPALYTVPFGNDISGHYLPLMMDLTTAGTGTSGWFSFATYPTDPFSLPNNRPLPTGMTSFTDLAGLENAHNVVDRFWMMNTEEYGTEPWARFTFTYRDSEWNGGTNNIQENLLQAQRWDGVWSNPPIGSVNTASNTVGTAPVNLFAQVWALVQSSMPLPVELLTFTAAPDNDDVLCSWTTATEINNDFFTVERSADGLAFTAIGEADGAGNSPITHAYAFTDKEPLSGLSYYRLRQTDFDGSSTLSNVVAHWREETASDAPIVLWPNPAGAVLNVAGISTNDQLSIVDATGRFVRDAGTADGSQIVIDVSSLAEGSYVMHIRGPKNERTQRFIRSAY